MRRVPDRGFLVWNCCAIPCLTFGGLHWYLGSYAWSCLALQGLVIHLALVKTVQERIEMVHYLGSIPHD